MGLPRLFLLAPVSALFHASNAIKTTSPNPSKFLIVSAPGDARIAYMKIKRGPPKPPVEGDSEMKDLITTGMVHPQGLAVDQVSRRLLVADPDSKRIFSYSLRAVKDTLHVGPQMVLANGTESRWVAVDPTGNVFFTDEARNQVLKISHGKALRGNTTPEVVLDGSAVAQVSAPGGIALDSFHAFWVNKQIGRQTGSVIKASKEADLGSLANSVESIAKNSDKSYGICLAVDNVFFTQPETTIYGVKKGGSTAVTISDRLTFPRGCAWDGDGTVFVADRGAHAVYSFAGNMQALGAAQFSKAADFKDAFGVAVYSSSAAMPLALRAAVYLLGLAAGLAAAAQTAA